ncbi:hypothetical protein CR513_34950, partial [Mucuna pruriens]
MNTTMHDLKMQIGQLANSVNQLQAVGSGNLTSQLIPNPKGGNMSIMTLGSGKELWMTTKTTITPARCFPDTPEPKGRHITPKLKLEFKCMLRRRKEKLLDREILKEDDMEIIIKRMPAMVKIGQH